MATCSVRYEPHLSDKSCLLKRPGFQSQNDKLLRHFPDLFSKSLLVKLYSWVWRRFMLRLQRELNKA